MNLYRFKTFRTSYYFPDVPKGCEFLYGLYTPFGSKLAKAYWWAFRHISFVRRINKVDISHLDFPFNKIMAMCPEGSTVSFNMGTPGPEQKISMLGLEVDGKHFFAKYSTKQAAMDLSRNEIKVLTALKATALAPILYDFCDESKFCFFRTSCLDGKSVDSLKISDEVVKLAININKHHLTEDSPIVIGLKMGLSHGDFTPWNLNVNNNSFHMIDWEMAAERELGYDIFTYIAHVSNIFNPTESVVKAIEANSNYINDYFHAFDVENWKPYLNAFAQRKIAYEKSKGYADRASQFECLL